MHHNRGGLYLSAYLTRWRCSSQERCSGISETSLLPTMRADAWPIWGSPEDSSSWWVAFSAPVHRSPWPMSPSTPNRACLQTLNIFSQDVDGIAGGATALLLGATSLAILRSRALPSWFAYVGLVLAIASFAIPMLGLPDRRSLAASHQRRGSPHVEKAENHHLIPCAATEGTADCPRFWLAAWVRGFPFTSSITSWSELRVLYGSVSRTDWLRSPQRQSISVGVGATRATRNLLNDLTAVEGCQDVNETYIWYLSAARGAFGSAGQLHFERMCA